MAPVFSLLRVKLKAKRAAEENDFSAMLRQHREIRDKCHGNGDMDTLQTEDKSEEAAKGTEDTRREDQEEDLEEADNVELAFPDEEKLL